MTAEDLIYEPVMDTDPLDPPILVGTFFYRIERIKKDRDWVIFYVVEEQFSPVVGDPEYPEYPERLKIEVNAGKANTEAQKWIKKVRHDHKGVQLALKMFMTPSGFVIQVLYLVIGPRWVFIARTPLIPRIAVPPEGWYK